MLRLKTQAPGVVALEAAAMEPDIPLSSKRRLIFVVFVLGSLMLGVAVPTAIDLIDRRLKTADEFEAILGFPPLGVALANGAGQESMRRIALGIMREWRTSGIRSYVLTSVRQGGNAYLALALADELGDLGVRALAIEASLTGPNGDRPKAASSGGSSCQERWARNQAVGAARCEHRCARRQGSIRTADNRRQEPAACSERQRSPSLRIHSRKRRPGCVGRSGDPGRIRGCAVSRPEEPAAFWIDEEDDRDLASDGISRFGAYVRQSSALAECWDGTWEDPGTRQARFAAAAWSTATGPVMAPGYVRHHPRVLTGKVACNAWDGTLNGLVRLVTPWPQPLAQSRAWHPADSWWEDWPTQPLRRRHGVLPRAGRRRGRRAPVPDGQRGPDLPAVRQGAARRADRAAR